ncbi:MAG TPA: DUF1616 domain-containing protein [Candidatus Bathyarchaeia archaeon]|nr:DUF1616 domain-containing protein [Candidatus Bathyarchaeia archaeon]
MSLKGYLNFFLAGSLLLILIASYPALVMLLPFPRSMELFSEIWILGPTRMSEGYPFNVSANKQYGLFFGVRNDLGRSAYYAVYVKFRNLTQPAPDSLNSKPSPLPLVYEFRVFLADGQKWEMAFNFMIRNVFFREDSSLVSSLSIDDVDFQVDCLSKWSSEYSGFYYQLFFELWLYDNALREFHYHDRFVGFWVNMTG